MFVFLGVTAISNRLIISELKLRPLARRSVVCGRSEMRHVVAV